MNDSAIIGRLSSMVGLSKLPEPDTRQAPPAMAPHAQGRPSCPPTIAAANLKPPAAAPASLNDEDPYVRTKPEKHGGAVVVLGGAVVVRAPGQSGEQGAGSREQEAEPAHDLDFVVSEYRKILRGDTKRHIYMGRIVREWILHQPELKARLPRAAAIIVIKERIEREGLAGVCKPHRDLKTYHTAGILGGDAGSIPVSAIWRLSPLVEWWQKGDEWRLVPQYADATKSLWARMLDGKMTVDQVAEEVAKIVGVAEQSQAIPKSRQLATILRLRAILTPDEIREVIRVYRDELKAKGLPGKAAA